MKKRKKHRRNNFLLFNIFNLLLCGIIIGVLSVYIEKTQHLPHYSLCENVNRSGHKGESNSPKDDYSSELHIDGTPDSQITQAVYVYPDNGVSVSGLECELDVTITKEWLDDPEKKIVGAQYDITFTNNTVQNMSDWYMQLAVPMGSKLDSYWSGEFSYDNSVITVKPLDYNNEIMAGENITFGFILHTSESTCYIEECSFVYYRECKIWQYPAFWYVMAILFFLLVVDSGYIISAFRIRKFNKRREQDLRIIEESLRTFAHIIDAKDCYTKGHSVRVATYSREIAERMKMGEYACQQLYYIALLHDIGKIGISDNILQKPGPLTKEERLVIEQHVTIGGEVLKDFTSIEGIAEGALYHHERYDGKGYPNGLKGDEIPLFARIICVADSFDAMSSARCYRPKLEIGYILNELKEKSGSQFDPAIAKYMIDMIEEGVAPISDDEEDGDICIHEH